MTPPTASPQAYRENTVLSASPEQLVVMLYDGARRFLRQAGSRHASKEIERAHNTLRRAGMIVAHLDGVLDYEQGEPIASQLHPIYQFLPRPAGPRAHGAGRNKLEEVSHLLGELRESWAEIAHG